MLLWACSSTPSGDDASPLDRSQPLPDRRVDAPTHTYAWPAPLDAILAPDGQLLLQGTLNGAGALLALDTGAFPTAVSKSYLKGGPLGAVDLVLGPITRKKLPVTLVDLSLASSFVGTELGALVGSDVLWAWYVGLDYERPAVYLTRRGPEALPPGGTGTPRIARFTPVLGVPVVEARLRGTADASVKLIADTGSGVTLLTESVFDKLDPDHELRRLEGYVWHTNSGSSAGFISRVPSISVGEAEVRGSWVVVVPDDHHLAASLKLAGLPAGFLGFPFYRAFLTLYAGPERHYLFYPGPTWRGAAEEWQRVGIELSRGVQGVVVEMVYRPSGAHQLGVRTGDRLLAVDGVAVEQRPLAEVLRWLRGRPGQQSRELVLRRGSRTLVVDVPVDDLLPPALDTTAAAP